MKEETSNGTENQKTDFIYHKAYPLLFFYHPAVTGLHHPVLLDGTVILYEKHADLRHRSVCLLATGNDMGELQGCHEIHAVP